MRNLSSSSRAARALAALCLLPLSVYGQSLSPTQSPLPEQAPPAVPRHEIPPIGSTREQEEANIRRLLSEADDGVPMPEVVLNREFQEIPLKRIQPSNQASSTDQPLRWWVSGSLMGAGLISLATGLGLALSINANQTEFKSLRTNLDRAGHTEDHYCTVNPMDSRCLEMHGLWDSMQGKSAWVSPLLITGGVCMVGGLVTALVWPAPAPSSLSASLPVKPRGSLFTWHIAPTPGPGQYGLSLSGSY